MSAALLIDFDNVTMGIRSDLQQQLRRLLDSEIIKGKVAVQRAYADWRRYPQYIVPLSEASIDLIFAPAFGSNKKNATDIRLAIDALELVFTRPEIVTFILLSGDSDFSSLVLKLKEYGKYVIGVGIRESSSDLLIQNCDEYYSYTELTGFTREGDMDSTQRDPWELVVEAVAKMKKEDDVMRSDRLKQVMQSIDPKFDEHDAGFSRFSKFVVEAQARGLLKLEKMDNGQYAVDLGDNANVSPDDEAELRSRKAGKEKAKPKRARGGRRRAAATSDGALTLAEAFELLRQALLVLGAVGDHPAGADEARAKMIELFGDEDDPVFQKSRFQRLLRQAHDANLIELAKDDGDGYQLRLGPEAAEDIEPDESEPAKSPDRPEERAETRAPPASDTPAEHQPAEKPELGRAKAQSRSRTGEEKDEGAKKRGPRSRTSSRRSSKSRGRGAGAKEAGEAPKVAAASESGSRKAAPSGGANRSPRRNPRFRRGARGSGTGGDVPAAPASSTDKPDAQQDEARPASSPLTSGARRVGARTGRKKGRGRASPRGQGGSAPAPPPAATDGRGGSQTASSKPPEPTAAPEAAPPADAEPQPQEVTGGEPRRDDMAAGADGGGLFKRMSAAIQKVVRGPESPDDTGA
jgi:uncharacterized protein (TIGR00288 family)